MSVEPDTQSVGGDTVHVMLRAIKSEPPGSPAPTLARPSAPTRTSGRLEVPAREAPRPFNFRRTREQEEKGLFTPHNIPILIACAAFMALGVYYGRTAVVAAAAPQPNPGGPVQERWTITEPSYGGGGGGSEDSGEEIQYTIYD